MDVAALLDMITGGGSEAAVGVTPRLTKRTQNLPQQQYDKTKKALKEPSEPTEPVVGIPAKDQEVEALLAMILGGQGEPMVQPGDDVSMAPLPNKGDLTADDLLYNLVAGEEITPKIKATKKGEPMAANTNLQSQLLKMILGITGKDEVPDGDADDPYRSKDDVDEDGD